jgi:hypothetical protein
VSTSEESRAIRAARNQALFREINERIESLNETFDALVPVGTWICECADQNCIEMIPMTLQEYEAVRANPARFPILPGHELPDVERVVERHEGYVVVEKLGAAAEFARRHDPRRSDAARP